MGHLGSFKPLAARLRREGHELTLAVRDTRYCREIFGDACAWFQAPRCDATGKQSPVTYADLLAGVGYADPAVLAGLVVAWRSLMHLTRPQLVFADHAPTAILAARTLGIPVMLFGGGFTLPPRCAPFPPMRPWEEADQAALAAREAPVLDNVNSVLARFGVPALPALHTLFDVADDALLTIPELDPFARPNPARYWGMVTMLDATSTRQAWPAASGPRQFAYIRGRGPSSTAVLDALRASGHPAIVYWPDADGAHGSSSTLTLVRRPVNMAHMLEEADLALLHGTSSAGAFLMAGKPVLVLAQHLEQYLSGMRIAQLGAGLVVRTEEPGAIASALRRLQQEAQFGSRARLLAGKYVSLTQSAVLDGICRRAALLARTN